MSALDNETGSDALVIELLLRIPHNNQKELFDWAPAKFGYKDTREDVRVKTQKPALGSTAIEWQQSTILYQRLDDNLCKQIQQVGWKPQ